MPPCASRSRYFRTCIAGCPRCLSLRLPAMPTSAARRAKAGPIFVLARFALQHRQVWCPALCGTVPALRHRALPLALLDRVSAMIVVSTSDAFWPCTRISPSPAPLQQPTCDETRHAVLHSDALCVGRPMRISGRPYSAQFPLVIIAPYATGLPRGVSRTGCSFDSHADWPRKPATLALTLLDGVCLR